MVASGLRLLPPPTTRPARRPADRAHGRPARSLRLRAAGAVPATQVSFPAGTSTVSIEVEPAGGRGQAPVEIVVSVGQPAATIIDNNYILDSSGATLDPAQPADRQLSARRLHA